MVYVLIQVELCFYVQDVLKLVIRKKRNMESERWRDGVRDESFSLSDAVVFH